MIKYKVLILGLKIDNLNRSRSIFQLLSYYIFLGFKKINYVEVFYYDQKLIESKLPIVDFVIIINYFNTKFNLNEIKRKTKAIKVCSLRENGSIYDFSFIFNSVINSENTYAFPPPCSKEILKPTIKKKNTILIDHYWKNYLGTEKDWTSRIENWLEEINNKYEIYRLIRFKNEEKNIKSFEIPLFYTDYQKYLNNTSKIEIFIITHQESYSYGVIDMAARGTKIISPSKFIPQCLMKSFEISSFNNKQDFFKLLSEPINKEKLNKQINSCIDYFDIVKEIDNFFSKWIKEKC